MNRCLVAVIAFALLVGTAPVSAADGGRGGHGGYSGGGHGGYSGGGHNNYGAHGYGGHGNGNGYNGYNGYHYAGHGNYYGGYRGYYARPAYYGYAPYYYHHDHDNSAAYLVGGLVVGSLLTNAYYQTRPAPYYTTQTVVQPTQVVVQAQGRHLLRDLNGDCFERTTDAAGNELRTQLPASECNW